MLRLAACLLPASAIAADSAGWTPHPESARFRRLDTEAGLSQASVMAFAQDRLGRIWLGTQSGLNRYDGHDVTVFRPQVGARGRSLSDNYVIALAVDGVGDVWVATLDGLNRIDPLHDSFEVFRHDDAEPHSIASSRIAALRVDRDGVLWIGGERGLSRLRADRRSFDNWALERGNAAGLPDDRITALAADADGRLLVGTTRGLARFDPAGEHFEPIAAAGLREAEITALQVDRHGRIWAGTDGQGLLYGRADDEIWDSLRRGDEHIGLISDSVHAILQDRAGRLWIGDDLGLDLIADPDAASPDVLHFRHYRHNPDGIGGGRIASLFEDRDGALWVGTWNGGASWLAAARNRFESFTPDQATSAGLGNPSSITLAATPGQLWVGTGEGLYRFDPDGRRLRPADPADATLTFFGSDRQPDRLWFGTSHGVRLIDPVDGRRQAPTLPDALAGGRVRRVRVDPDRVWLATDPIGLALVSPDLGELERLYPIARSVTFIRAVGRYRLVGSYDGLYWFDGDSGALLHTHRLVTDGRDVPGLGAAPMDVRQADDGRLWLATNGAGLREIVLDDPAQPASARFLVTPDGLADPALKSLLIDARGVLWLSSASGISAYQPATGRWRNFDRSDGTLAHDYINASAAMLADGRLAFGAMDGFTVFEPAQVPLEPPAPPPAPLLTGLELDSRPAAPALTARMLEASVLPDAAALQLPPGSARSLGLRFTSPDYVHDDVHYQYQLEPFDPHWVDDDAGRRIAAWTNLEPGRYRFRVRAALPASDYGPPTELEFVIEPFWWQTWWARGGAVLTVLLLLAVAYNLRLRHAAALQALLTRQVAERTAALERAKVQAEQALQQLESTQQELVRSEKMAALGQLVAGVAHEVNTPLGVALTASSYVTDAAKRIRRAVDDGALKRSDLNTFVDNVEQSNVMIQRNLDRAGQLIANFKQVSVDRSSDGRRRFRLAPYLDELLQSLQLMWKRRSIETTVECPDDIELDGFPGALGQIITNLMQNSVRHGFVDERGGHMRLAVRRLDGDRIELVHEDDGVGIPPENLPRIFDPFFTTQRNQGGTGLGLHIVFNLVTQKLGGSIRVTSEPGQGARFVVVLPTVAPD